MNKITRRKFIKGSAVAGIGSSLPLWSKVIGANNDIRVAIVGFRGQGKGHIKRSRKLKGVRVVALCDADKDIIAREKQKFTDDNERVKTYTDVRKLLEDKNIDAIVTATPNHWHSLVTVWACQAGKDVYVEKPASHEIWEGRKMVEAARKYKRIVQVGTQSRSSTALKKGFKYINEGNLGKILWVRGFCYKERPPIGKVSGPQKPPSGVDYNLWCGPAPMKPLMRKELHYDWHWVWDTGNGDIGNQGIHQMDVARWALGQEKLAPKVISIGGRFGYDDDGETPNTQISFFDYKPAPLIFEVRGLPKRMPSHWSKSKEREEKTKKQMDNYKGIRVGVVVQCENGYFPAKKGGWCYDNNGKKIKQFKGGGTKNHLANFIDAVRSRKVSDLKADIEVGHTSSALCHMGNISYQVGKERSPKEIKEIIKGKKELKDSFESFLNHMDTNEIDLKKSPAVIGPMLTMDPDKERFTGKFSEEANKYIKRDYRKGFEVPEKV